MRTVFGAEFRQHVLDMGLGRLPIDRQACRDLLLRMSGRNQLKNLDLPSRQRDVRRVLRDLDRDVGLNAPFSLINDSDGIQYFGTHEALQHVSLRAGL